MYKNENYTKYTQKTNSQSAITLKRTRNVSMGHGCPHYCQIRINRALTKGHNSNNNRWILSIIELDLYFMITYLCMKYESITPTYSKDIAQKPSFIRISRAITLIIIDLYFMIIYLCMKYESIPIMYSKDIAQKPFFVPRSRAITLMIIGGF